MAEGTWKTCLPSVALDDPERTSTFACVRHRCRSQHQGSLRHPELRGNVGQRIGRIRQLPSAKAIGSATSLNLDYHTTMKSIHEFNGQQGKIVLTITDHGDYLHAVLGLDNAVGEK